MEKVWLPRGSPRVGDREIRFRAPAWWLQFAGDMARAQHRGVAMVLREIYLLGMTEFLRLYRPYLTGQTPSYAGAGMRIPTAGNNEIRGEKSTIKESDPQAVRHAKHQNK